MSTSINLTGLDGCTEYEFSIRTYCDIGNISDGTSPVKFTTDDSEPEVTIQESVFNTCTLKLKVLEDYPSYVWSVGGGSETSDSIFVENNGSYSVTVTDGGCTGFGTINVTIDKKGYYCPSASEDSTIADTLDENFEDIVYALRLIAQGLTSYQTDTIVTQIVSDLADDTTKYGQDKHSVRLIDLDTALTASGYNLLSDMQDFLYDQGSSASDTALIGDFYEKFSFAGLSNAEFYPAIFVNYLNPDVRDATESWDGRSFTRALVYYAQDTTQIPTYKLDGNEDIIIENLPASQIVESPMWQIHFTDNLKNVREVSESNVDRGFSGCICDYCYGCGGYDVLGGDCGIYVLTDPCGGSCPTIDCDDFPDVN